MAQWTTRDFGAPAVRWGVQSGVVQHQNNGSYSTYTKLQMCGAPANSKGTILHHGPPQFDCKQKAILSSGDVQSLPSPQHWGLCKGVKERLLIPLVKYQNSLGVLSAESGWVCSTPIWICVP